MSEQRKPGEVEGYEKLDAAPGPTTRAGIYLLAAMFLVAAVVAPLYWLYARREAETQPRAATVLKAVPPPGVFPRLVTNEPRTLAEFRAKEDALLGSYGWIEKDRGIARLPIAEALRIVGERGSLPRFAALPPAEGPAPPGGTR